MHIIDCVLLHYTVHTLRNTMSSSSLKSCSTKALKVPSQDVNAPYCFSRWIYDSLVETLQLVFSYHDQYIIGIYYGSKLFELHACKCLHQHHLDPYSSIHHRWAGCLYQLHQNQSSLGKEKNKQDTIIELQGDSDIHKVTTYTILQSKPINIKTCLIFSRFLSKEKAILNSYTEI